MEGLRSADALRVHWEAAHSKDNGEGAKATSSSTSGGKGGAQGKVAAKQQLDLFVPPPPLAGEDELEHYRLQVKIMADIINVSTCTYMYMYSGRMSSADSGYLCHIVCVVCVCVYERERERERGVSDVWIFNTCTCN